MVSRWAQLQVPVHIGIIYRIRIPLGAPQVVLRSSANRASWARATHNSKQSCEDCDCDLIFDLSASGEGVAKSRAKMLRTVVLLGVAVALGHAVQLFECASNRGAHVQGEALPAGTSGGGDISGHLTAPKPAACEPVRSFSGLFVERLVDTMETGAALGTDTMQALCVELLRADCRALAT